MKETEGLIKLAVVIAAWDILRWHRGKPTFSVQFGNLLEANPKMALGSWAVLSHHLLCSILPPWARRTWRMPNRKAV